MAKTIVGRPLIGVHQDVVSFTELFEFLLGLRVVGVLVRVIFDRELAISTLHFLLGGVPRDGQHFVIVALLGGHGSYRSYLTYEPLETTTLEGRSRRSFIL